MAKEAAGVKKPEGGEWHGPLVSPAHHPVAIHCTALPGAQGAALRLGLCNFHMKLCVEAAPQTQIHGLYIILNCALYN
jgi:hypothetical protein